MLQNKGLLHVQDGHDKPNASIDKHFNPQQNKLEEEMLIHNTMTDNGEEAESNSVIVTAVTSINA